MSSYPPISARPLDPIDIVEAISLARASGVHGLYIGNSITDATDLVEDEVLAFYGVEKLLGLAWFGRRGNLILVEGVPLDPMQVVPAIHSAGATWRIALGSAVMIHALAALEDRPVLVDRPQVYYGIRPGEVKLECVTADVRSAHRSDTRALVDAALDLNESDLNVDRWRVNRSWLKDSIKRRIAEDRTMVLGPVGAPWCKLDLGSRGPVGVMIEGVFTVHDRRRQGLATKLVATVAERLLQDYDFVCLHVDAENTAARKAYERAGMTVIGECQLLLRN